MLLGLQEKSKGCLTWGIIIIICIAFALWGIGYYFTSSAPSSRAVAKVNGKKITAQQLNSSYQRLRQIKASQIGQQAVISQSKAIKKQALNSLIMQASITQYLENHGLYLSKEQINQIIMQAPSFQEKGKFSASKYQIALQNFNMTPAQLQQEFKSIFLINQYEAGLSRSAFVFPHSVLSFMKLAKQTRDISYVKVPYSNFTAAKVTTKAAKDYYLAHKADFYSKSKVRLEYLSLSLAEMAKHIKVSHAEIMAYYGAKNSEKSKPTKKELVKIKQTLQNQAAAKIYSAKGNRLANLTYESPLSLNTAATALGLKVKYTKFFSRAGGDTSLTQNKQVLRAAFSPVTLKQHYNSDAINLSAGHVVVVRLDKYLPSKLKSFAVVKAQIVKILQAQLLQAKAKSYVKVSIEKLQQGKQLKLTWQRHDNVARNNGKINVAIMTAAFDASKPLNNKAIYTSANLKDAIAIVKVDNFKLGKVDKADLKSYRLALEASLSAEAYESAVNAIKAKTKVKLEDNV